MSDDRESRATALRCGHQMVGRVSFPANKTLDPPIFAVKASQ